MKKECILLSALLLLLIVSVAGATPVLDNSGGGSWKYYLMVPCTPTTTFANYKIVISGVNVSIYNVTGSLKTQTQITNFWNLVSPNGTDIRFFNQNSELYFWIEKWDYADQYAVIWVNLTAGSTELDMAYGNPSALPSSYNKANKTLIFADDFNTNDLDTIWFIKSNNGIITIENGLLELIQNTGTTGGQVYAVLPKALTNDFVFLVKAKFNPAGYGRGISIADSSSYSSRTNAVWIHGDTSGNRNPAIVKDEGGTITVLYNFPTLQSGVWHTYMITVSSSGGLEAYVDGSLVTTSTFSPTQPLQYIDIGNDAVVPASGDWTDIYVDYVIVAKLADPATFGTPSVSMFGTFLPTAAEINVTYRSAALPSTTLYVNVTYLDTGSTSSYNPTMVYVPYGTTYNASASLDITGVNATTGANITILLDANKTLTDVVYNGTDVLANLTSIGTVVLNGLTYNAWNLTVYENGTLTVYALTSPITVQVEGATLYLSYSPLLLCSATAFLPYVNTTYGANVTFLLNTHLTFTNVSINGTFVNATLVSTSNGYNEYFTQIFQSGELVINTTIPNLAYNTSIQYGNTPVNATTPDIAGEPVTVSIPVTGNISIAGDTFANVTSATYTPMYKMDLPVNVVINNTTAYQFGEYSKVLKVEWGKVNLTLLDVNGRPVHFNYGIYNLNYAKVTQNPHTLLAGENKITVYYMGLPLETCIFYLNHTNTGLNITLTINATNISSMCYNLTVVSPSKFTVVNLSRIPYGKFAVNHTGEVIITFENNSPVTVTVTGSRYMYASPYLYLYGSGNATITSYYALKADAESALGVPMNVTVNINGVKKSVYGCTRFVLPVDSYRISFPKEVLGFVLNDTNLTNTTVNLTTSLQIPKAVYKVPTHIVLSAYKVNTSSFKFPFLPLPFPLSTSSNGVQACIEGTLYNWYGSPVPNANVTVNITSLKTGFTITKVVNTGSTGTFSINFSVVPGVNYSISAEYNGSSVYVNSSTKIVVAGGALPPAPSEAAHTNVVVFAAVLTATLLSIGGAAYLIHKKRVAKLVSRAERKGKYFRRIK